VLEKHEYVGGHSISCFSNMFLLFAISNVLHTENNYYNYHL